MLKNRIREARQSDEGFTLIELLIVIIVLGILAGIVVFGVGTFRQDATQAAACADEKTVNVASQAFNAKTGGYAASIAALETANYLESVPAGVAYDATTGIADAAACP